MEQVFEGTPQAEIQLDGRKVTRSDVTHDWGSRLEWQIRRDGKELTTVPARLESSYEHPDQTPGKYEIVLRLFKYLNYKKDASGQYTESKFLEISNTVSYTI
jgi:hypothetical protein